MEDLLLPSLPVPGAPRDVRGGFANKGCFRLMCRSMLDFNVNEASQYWQRWAPVQ